MSTYTRVKILGKAKTLVHIDVIRCFKWECPICGDVHESEMESILEFKESLFKDIGVRYVELPHMQGVCCKNCYEDPEIQASSL